ncbi:Hypothetical protein FRIFI_1403 [Romboutsia hominis]|uniref:Uncharacterized protein n=1 Tax=Romboutsia hominis TaxID=1507512 RepID=A0A2P2BRD9_9FIRM|nr:Hypothetical protein FRIFI_1403 [Romboutsia hominis]
MDIRYEGKAIVNNEHLVEFELDEYNSIATCPSCKELCLEPDYNYCPFAELKLNLKRRVNNGQ